MALTYSQAKAYYDRFGAKQDSQSFYEDAAIDDLVKHASFQSAESVFELGCGTGRFASQLLAEYLQPTATYIGIDISPTMTKLTEQRVSQYADRAKIILSDGSMHYPLDDRSVDRVVATYVFDLLSATDIANALSEAYRVLSPNGILCLVSLTNGNTIASKMVSSLWSTVFKMRASLVGGCRPIELREMLGDADWSIEYLNTIVRFGVPSEIVVARKKSDR